MCALNLPNHSAVKTIFDYSCGVCGTFLKKEHDVDFSVMNFERYKWGGVRHLDPIYEMFDLEQFSSMEKTEPNIEDYKILERIVSAIIDLPEEARPGDIEKALSSIVKSNKDERRVLIQILGYCGILETDEYKGFYRAYTNEDSRPIPPVNKIDWTFPVCWWRGRYSINRKNLKDIFGI